MRHDDARSAVSPRWPVNLQQDQQRTRHARERLLADGLLAAPVAGLGIRDIIERSWRRCIGDAVPTDRHDIPYRDVTELHPGLRAAAAPVLDRLSDELSGVRVAMFLSDQQGRIIMRCAREPKQRDVLDNACAAEGFDFSEPSIGTNGLGTVLTERRPMLVHGAEHYNELLEPLTCAGTPIVEPFTGRILGTFALACHSADANALMCAMAADVGRQIEGNLTAMLGIRERALIHSYLLAAGSDRDPVIVVTERCAFANTAGLAHINADAHALLWTHLTGSDLPRRQRQRRTVPLPTGPHAAVVERVDDGTASPAYCLRLLPAARRPEAAQRRSGNGRGGGPRTPLHPLPDIDRQLATALGFGECLAVDGAPGTGKRHTASAALASLTGVPPRVVDLSVSGVEDLAANMPPAGPRVPGIVLRHLQDLDPADVNRVKAVVEQATAGLAGEGRAPAGVPVAVTVDLDNASGHVHTLVAQLCTAVRLPRLAEMPEQVPQLIRTMLRDMPEEPQRQTRFSSDALQTLMRWSWPGNLAELRRTVELLSRRMPGRAVGVADLPARMQRIGPREPTMMETAERDTIIAALRRAGGNRTRAARSLGIGRTTLYRKIHAHHIEG